MIIMRREIMSKCNNIELEYSIFKFRMLSKTPREIYDNCNVIRFYECVHEYLIYNENVPGEFMEHIKTGQNILRELYHIYLKYEGIRIDSWEEIDNLIDIYMIDNLIDSNSRKNVLQEDILC